MITSVIDFFTEVKVELQRVVWPTPDTTIRLTIIVILVTIIVAFFVGGLDYLLTLGLTAFLNR